LYVGVNPLSFFDVDITFSGTWVKGDCGLERRNV
jgi:hypothetical protein